MKVSEQDIVLNLLGPSKFSDLSFGGDIHYFYSETAFYGVFCFKKGEFTLQFSDGFSSRGVLIRDQIMRRLGPQYVCNVECSVEYSGGWTRYGFHKMTNAEFFIMGDLCGS